MSLPRSVKSISDINDSSLRADGAKMLGILPIRIFATNTAGQECFLSLFSASFLH